MKQDKLMIINKIDETVHYYVNNTEITKQIYILYQLKREKQVQLTILQNTLHNLYDTLHKTSITIQTVQQIQQLIKELQKEIQTKEKEIINLQKLIQINTK